MAKKEFINIVEGINGIRILRDDLPNSKAKRNFDKTTINIKKVYDKLYHYAFYDYRFKTCNYNKLLEDFKGEYEKPKVKLLFIRVPKMVESLYSDSNRKIMIAKLINDLKEKVKNEYQKFKFKCIYTIDDFIILVVKKDFAEDVYYSIKKNKNIYNLDLGIHFVKYNAESVKINKNIDACINEAIKITKGKKHDEHNGNQIK